MLLTPFPILFSIIAKPLSINRIIWIGLISSILTMQYILAWFANFMLLWSSFFVTHMAKKYFFHLKSHRILSGSSSGLIWCTITIKVMRTDVVVADICKFFYRLIERLFCLKFIQIRAFIFQRIKISSHWRTVIRVPCLTHALFYMDGFTEFYKCL